jgi:hypothetical protein
MQLFIKEKGIVTRTNESRENCWSGDQQELEGLKEIKDSTKRENSQVGRPELRGKRTSLLQKNFEYHLEKRVRTFNLG